jgi:hypothetical protein
MNSPTVQDLLPLFLFVSVSEAAKLTLIGCYILDLEPHLTKPLHKNLFEKLLSFFTLDEFNLSEANRIRDLWVREKQAAAIDEVGAV